MPNKLIDILNSKLSSPFVIDDVIIGHQPEEGMYKMHFGHHYVATLIFCGNQLRITNPRRSLSKEPIVFDLDDPAFDPESLIEIIVDLAKTCTNENKCQYH